MATHKQGKLWICRREFRQACEKQEDAQRLDAIVEAALVRARRRFAAGAMPCPTILEALPDFLREQEIVRQNDPGTIKLYRRRLQLWARSFPGPIDMIGREDVVTWAEARLQTKGKARRYDKTGRVSRSTVNSEIGALRRLARWLCDSGKVDDDLPVLRVPRIRTTGKIIGNRFPPRAWTAEAVRQALDKIDAKAPHVGLALRGIALLGARPKAAFDLTWGAVSLPHCKRTSGSVRLVGLKGMPEGAVPVAVGSPVHSLLLWARWLFRKMRGRKPGNADHVFITKRGRSRRRSGGWTSDVFSAEVRRLCKALEIAGDFVPYTIRHSAISWLQGEQGISLADVQAYARHARITTQESYALAGAALPTVNPAAAYAAIGRILWPNGAAGKHTEETGNCESASA